MHDVVRVGLRQPARHLRRDLDGLRRRQRTAVDLRRQRLALVIRHHDAQAAVPGFIDRVDRSDVRMVERRCRPRLLQEEFARALRRVEVPRQKLQRDRAAELRSSAL